MQEIVLSNGAPALLAGALTPSLSRATLGAWPQASASECAAALGATLERLLALDDVLHWRELGGAVVLLVNVGLLFDDAASLDTGEPQALAEVAGAATGTDGALVGCFISVADGAACRFVEIAALKRGWLDLGGWALVRGPNGADI